MLWTADKIGRVVIWGEVCAIFAMILKCLDITEFFAVFLPLWTICAGSYLFLGSMKLHVRGKFVLITGCDSGFGHVLALHLERIGFGVFACCLDAEGDGAKSLKEKGSSKLYVLQMDVTNSDQIKKAVTQIKYVLGDEGKLWGIVNNAGINPFGAIEWVPMEMYKKVCDVNLHGTIAVTKAMLPLIRKAKGRVVNVSSIRGRVNSPYGCVYEISKWAIEGYNDCLRAEMKPFDVKVCLIEPGNFAAGTKIFTEDAVRVWGEKMWTEMDDEVKEAYGGKTEYDAVIKKIVNSTHTGETNLTEVVEAMTEALVQRYPQARYQPMSPRLYCAAFSNTHFPEWLSDRIFKELVLKRGW